VMLVRAWRDARVLAQVESLVARRAAVEPSPAAGPSSVLSPAQQTSVVATLREAAAAAAATTLRAPRPAIELRKQVADRVFDLHEACERKGLSLSYEALHPVHVLASAQQVDGIISPLLRRALSASRHGDVLRIALRLADDEARVHVEDAGRNANGVVVGGTPGRDREPEAEVDDRDDVGATTRNADDADTDPIIVSARRDLEALGGTLDVLRLQAGALRLTARFPRATEAEAEAAAAAGTKA